MRNNSDYQRFNVFRTPDWRFRRVLSLIERYPTAGRCTFHDDEWVRKARNFVLRWRNSEEGLPRDALALEHPGLSYAYAINERTLDFPQPAMFMQARLLAGQSPVQIAEELSTIPDTVRWYEALFFNVADRLKHRDWITMHVLMPAIMRRFGQISSDPNERRRSRSGTSVHPAVIPPEDEDEDEDEDDAPARDRGMFSTPSIVRPFLDASLKLFAYFGGPILCDIMIHGLQSGRPLTSHEDMPRWFDETWALTIRRRSTQAALQFEVNKFNVMDLFATHARILEIEKSAESQENKRSTLERHVKQMLDDMPFRIGDEERVQELQDTKLLPLNKLAGELRDDEMIEVLNDKQDPALLPDLSTVVMPPPRKQQARLESDKIFEE